MVLIVENQQKNVMIVLGYPTLVYNPLRVVIIVGLYFIEGYIYIFKVCILLPFQWNFYFIGIYYCWVVDG